jgi:archaellum component FlaC
MATRWQVDRQERIRKVEAVVGEFRGRFDAIDHRFDEIDRRFEAIDLKFDTIDRRFEAVDRRFDELEERLNNKIDMQVEHFEEVVNRTAESFSGVLSRLERGLTALTDEVRQQSKQTALILRNHEGRISAIERERRL